MAVNAKEDSAPPPEVEPEPEELDDAPDELEEELLELELLDEEEPLAPEEDELELPESWTTALLLVTEPAELETTTEYVPAMDVLILGTE